MCNEQSESVLHVTTVSERASPRAGLSATLELSSHRSGPHQAGDA